MYLSLLEVNLPSNVSLMGLMGSQFSRNSISHFAFIQKDFNNFNLTLIIHTFMSSDLVCVISSDLKAIALTRCLISKIKAFFS